MRESHHDFEVGGGAVEGTAHPASIGYAGNILPATGAAVRATFVRGQGAAILMDEVNVLYRPIPIDVAGIVRLVVGAAFQ